MQMCVHIHIKKHTNTQVEALPMSENLNSSEKRLLTSEDEFTFAAEP